MTDDDLNELLQSTLEPTLLAAGFAPGQGDWSGITYCADQDDFSARFPWLPQATPEEWQLGSSTDFTIEFDQTTGVLGFLHLEGKTLYATLWSMGLKDLAAELRAALSLPLSDSLPVVARALGAVFTDAEA